VLVGLSGSAAQPSLPSVRFNAPRVVDEPLGAVLSFRQAKANNHSLPQDGNPYRPNPIHDPFSDINCESLKCAGGLETCPDSPYRLCEKYGNCPKNKVCLHKQLFPMLQQDLLLFVSMFLIAVCAGAAGIGGGGLNVPILMMINAFGIKEAVPLSHAAVMGNAFAQLLVNGRQRHPDAPNRPLIHYELAILALPAQLGGNSLGVVIGRTFPPTVLIILSLCMLALAGTKTFIKGIEEMKKAAAKKRPALTSSPRSEVGTSLPGVTNLPSSPRMDAIARTTSGRSKEGFPIVRPAGEDGMEYARTWSGTAIMPRLPALTTPFSPAEARSAEPGAIASTPDEVEKMRMPWNVIGCMVGFNVIFCLDFLGMAPDVFGIQKCTGPYWVFLLGLYPFVAGSIWIGIKSLNGLAEYHSERGDPHVTGDPEVTMRLIILFPLAAVIIGLVAGLVGLGGGEFMVPLLLEFGLMPRVASATSGFLILFATSSNIVHYAVANIMEPFLAYAVAVIVLAFFGAFTGLMIRDTKFMRENAFLLVFLLAGLLFVSAGLLAYRGFAMSDLDFSFKSFCPLATTTPAPSSLYFW